MIKNPFSLTEEKVDKLNVVLERKFLNKRSSDVGHSFEDIIVDYFNGNFEQLNSYKKQVSFGDISLNENIIYSVKFSSSKTWNQFFSNNFRFTDYAWLINNTILGNFNNGNGEIENLRNINNLQDIEKIINDNDFSKYKFGIIKGNIFNINNDLFLEIIHSEILNAEEIWKRTIPLLEKYNITTNIRGHMEKIFREKEILSFTFEREDESVRIMKDRIDNEVMKQKFKSEDGVRLSMLNILANYEDMI